MDPSSGYHGGVDPSILERDAGCHAHQAVHYDHEGNYDLAIFYYIVSKV